MALEEDWGAGVPTVFTQPLNGAPSPFSALHLLLVFTVSVYVYEGVPCVRGCPETRKGPDASKWSRRPLAAASVGTKKQPQRLCKSREWELVTEPSSLSH